MNEILKNIIGNVIKMKHHDVMDLNFKDMTLDEKEEHSKISNAVSTLEGKLKMTLTEDQWDVVSDLMDAIFLMSAIEQEYMFNHGVKMGLNDLSFIKEELGDGVISLW